ncbi:hypothetical protein FACS18942_00630 [Planctomycetales bacterium]|nr:hypothetical protein FACS18942_00630 [Planctomycetales bacterium]
MLLQENQRLEDALYTTHAQLVDTKRENDAIKNSMSNSSASSVPIQRSLQHSRGITPQDATDDAPLFPPVKVEIPPDSPEKSSLPDLLKKTQVQPHKPPKSKVGLPELVPPDAGASIINDAAIDTAGDSVNVGDSMPVWKPTRQH